MCRTSLRCVHLASCCTTMKLGVVCLTVVILAVLRASGAPVPGCFLSKPKTPCSSGSHSFNFGASHQQAGSTRTGTPQQSGHTSMGSGLGSPAYQPPPRVSPLGSGANSPKSSVASNETPRRRSH